MRSLHGFPVTLTAPPFRSNCKPDDEVRIGKFSRPSLGICLWTAFAASDLTRSKGPFRRAASASPFRELTQHERYQCGDRMVGQGRAGTWRPAALDDFHRAFDLCRLP